MSDCKLYTTPVDTQTKVSSNMGAPISDPTAYRAWLRLSGTSPSPGLTSPTVQQVCLHMHDPPELHLTVAKHIIWYL
jgi:hypothetical protein